MRPASPHWPNAANSGGGLALPRQQFAGGLIRLVPQSLSEQAGSSLGFAEGVELSKLHIAIPHQNQVARFALFQGHVHTDERLFHIAPAALRMTRYPLVARPRG